jgi:hypothetical protein
MRDLLRRNTYRQPLSYEPERIPEDQWAAKMDKTPRRRISALGEWEWSSSALSQHQQFILFIADDLQKHSYPETGNVAFDKEAIGSLQALILECKRWAAKTAHRLHFRSMKS